MGGSTGAVGGVVGGEAGLGPEAENDGIAEDIGVEEAEDAVELVGGDVVTWAAEIIEEDAEQVGVEVGVDAGFVETEAVDGLSLG
jgi:hypothetical protein